MINIFGLTLHLYGLLIGLGIWAAWEMALVTGKRNNVPVAIIDSVVWWLVIGGIAGARAYHVIDLWSRYYSYQPVKIFFIWEGGLAIWGAIIGGVLGLMTYLIYQKMVGKKLGIKSIDLVDTLIVGLPLAQAIGRLGNFANNELTGKNGEPLFAYEASANMLLFILLWKLSKKRPAPGIVSGAYFLGYGLIRMALENLRPNEIIWSIGGIPVAILFGIMSFLLGSFLILRKK